VNENLREKNEFNREINGEYKHSQQVSFIKIKEKV
jgi:hypothetical protein